VLDGITATTSELNKVDGFTGNKDDLNYAKDLRATGVTTTEFNKLDGLTASTADLNTAASHYVPSGGIIMWSGSIGGIPSGWSLCDGGNGTPDLRDRFVVGAGGSYGVNATGGQNSVQLTEGQMPSHDHSMGSAGSHSHSGSTDTDTASGAIQGTKLGLRNASGVFSESGSQQKADGLAGSAEGNRLIFNHSHNHSLNINSNGNHTHTINNTGGNGSHENRPPYYALAYIMKL